MISNRLARSFYHLILYHGYYRHALRRRATTRLHGFHLVVEPSVMHPRFFRSGMIFSRYLSTLDLRGKQILDLGTGSGILALSAASRGALVTASDINPIAVHCASDNFRRNGFDSTIRTLEGHLFARLSKEQFDIIVFNPPYYDEKQKLSRDPALYGGKGLSLIEDFGRQASEFLKPGGYLLLILSTDSGINHVLRILAESKFSPQLVYQERTLFEDFFVYKFTPSNEMDSILVCPSCRGMLALSQGGWECRNESLSFPVRDGIPDFILPGRRATIGNFLQIYQSVRRNERWGSDDPVYYRELPYRDLTNEHSNTWAIRARSYDCFLDLLGHDIPDSSQSILDLGAGNCWLSNRLSRFGHRVIAVDVNTDPDDGLGAAQRFHDAGGPGFKWFRAEFGFLPFAEHSFDCIVFNASLHYAPDPYETVVRTLPLLKKTGCIYILDSPIYSNMESGEAMVKERIESFSHNGKGTLRKEYAGSYLTFQGLDQLKKHCAVDMFMPSYGLLWNLRPFVAKLRRKRQPASFAVIRLRHREADEQDPQ